MRANAREPCVSYSAYDSSHSNVLLVDPQSPVLRFGLFNLTAGRPVVTALWTLEFQCGIPGGTLRITPVHDMTCGLCTE